MSSRIVFFGMRRLAVPILSCLPLCALASNAIYLIGYGTESTLMGGADVAVARDTFAINNNPAGLPQISGKALDINASPFDGEGITHSDNFGNHRQHTKSQFGMYGNLGYAEHMPDSPYTFGIALVVQGGLGWVYKDMTTAFGTRDEATSLFTILKLAPAVGWKVNDRLNLGAALGLNYASGAQTLFPNTSTPTFSGINFKDASGYGFSAKFGMQYRPVDDVVIGLTYGTKASIPLKGGTLRVNYSNAGLGIVRYDDARMKGLTVPQEIALGISFRPLKPLLISIQDKWYDWSEALKSFTLTAKNPRSPTPPGLQQLRSVSQVGAFDQHAYSIGAAYDYNEATTLFGGLNYGRRTIPEQNLSPTFGVIQQMHYTAGMRRKIGNEWFVDTGIERLPRQMVTVNNPALPFGPSVETHAATVIHVTASRRWE